MIAEMIDTKTITSPRLKTRVLFSGPDSGTPIVFVHGNLSSADWWRGVMARLPAGFRAIAPDLRSYAGADPAAKVDAKRGLGDFVDDLAALMETLGLSRAHFVGHSLGGGVLWPFLAAHSAKVQSLTQVCPSSPYGFGAAKADGSPCFADGAGSGAGAVNPEFARLLAEKAMGTETPFHPLSILSTYVWKPPFMPSDVEMLLKSALSQHCGAEDYPGDVAPSPNWPGAGPGVKGPINALAPIYQKDPLAFTRAAQKPPILWLRGADDPVVSDASLFDLGTLGQLGAVPGWPGAEVFPPQPMVSQTRTALQAYQAGGGQAEEVVIEDCGHSPYLEKPAAFDKVFHSFLAKA